jgi:hypothetical protein
MRELNLLLAAGAAAMLAGCGMGADYPQFGETSYRIEGMTASANDGATKQTVIYRDGPNMRVETMLPNYGQATIVFDESTNAAYVLNPTGQVATTPAPAVGANETPSAATTPATPPANAPNTNATTPAPSAAAQTVGVAVRIDDADAPQPLETAWQALGEENARSTGRCEVAGEDGREWTPREAPAPGVERTACITEDGIVLRITENGRALWEATSLQRGQQDAALFGVPPGYQLIDPQRVAEEVGENMEQLDSVTGDGATQPAPDPRG